jgi:hypothetical protein
MKYFVVFDNNGETIGKFETLADVDNYLELNPETEVERIRIIEHHKDNETLTVRVEE